MLRFGLSLLGLSLLGLSSLLACGRTTTDAPAGGGGGGDGGGSGGTTTTEFGVVAQSCDGLAESCQGESCCTSIVVPGGTFTMGDDALLGGGAAPAHRVTLDDFALDKYEVTIGRYRRFIAAYDGTPPPEGAGFHEHVPEGTGWQTRWNKALPATRQALLDIIDKRQNATAGDWSWTPEPGPNETHPIGILSWSLAAMFCIWDGGRLPTDAEWEYAATGGDEERPFPWGSTPSAAQQPLPCDYANFNWFMCAPGASLAEARRPLLPVGSFPKGVGRWGHHDLSGNAARELAFDSYLSGRPVEAWERLSEKNPIYLAVAVEEERVMRDAGVGTPLYRQGTSARGTDAYKGLRCARAKDKLPQ